MRCYSGIKVKDRIVPCRQCYPCRINIGRQWTSRILLEQKYNPTYSLFVTLTYDNDHLPREIDVDGAPVESLKKKQFLQWINNSARKFPYRYLAVGEYGDDSGRPHYHMAAFPKYCVDPYRAREVFDDLWPYGRTQVAEINDARAKYLAGYSVKKLTSADDWRLKGNQQPEFRTSSKNPPIGAACIPFLVNHYRKSKNKELYKMRGDIDRTFTIARQPFTLTKYILDKTREQLGISLTHSDRIAANSNYLLNFPTHEAEQCPEKAQNLADRLMDKSRHRKYRNGPRV